MARAFSILLVAAFAATALQVGATGHDAISPAFRISNASADPARPFEAFDAVTIAAVDLTGDGVKEILAHNDNNRFYVFSASGRLLAELDTPHPSNWGARELAGPAVGDVNGNGRLDVVVTNSAGWVVAFEAWPADGGVRFVKLWENYMDPHHEDPNYSQNMPYGQWGGSPGMDAPVYLADTNGNGKDASFVQLDNVPGLFKLSGAGNTLWYKWVSDGNGGAIAADLTGDGRLEVAFPSDGGQVLIYDAESMRHRCTFHAQGYGAWPASISVTPGVGDLTGDGRQELVFGVRNVAHDRSDPDWIYRSHAHYFAINADCQAVWHKTWTWGNPHIYMMPAVVDANGDGRLDAIFHDWNTVGHKPGNWQTTGPSNLFAVDGASGRLLWRAELANYWSNKNVAVADVTGDGVPEILANEVRSGDGIGLYGLDGARRGFVSGPNGWVVTRGPTVVDLEGDGALEIILPVHRGASGCSRNLDVGCREGALQVYRTGSSASPLYSNSHVLNADVRPPAPGDPVDPPPDEPPEASPEGVTFANVRGNEWWVEVEVRGASSADVRVDGGAWKALGPTDWGSFAKSMHVPAGSLVQFRAGDTESSCYAWPEASPTSCPTEAPTPEEPESGDPSFSDPRGNEWWVEVEVSASEVALRVDGGAWKAMEATDWGSWARSLHVPSGSQVQFQAVSGGETVRSGCYEWPAATPVACGGGGGFQASFVSVRGNAWWVETEVRSDQPIDSVKARVNGGTWTTLPPTDWGSHAKSIHVPAGSTVEFRATSGGSSVDSQGYTWPP